MTRDELKRRALLVPCKDKAALYRWFKFYLKVDLFDTIVSRDATSSPMDAAWELYNFAMNPSGKTPENYLYSSSRNTQKTLLLAAVETAIILHDRRPILHYAANKEQIKPARKYMREYANRPFIKDLLKSDPTSTSIVYLVPKYDHPLWLEGKTVEEIMKEDSMAVREVDLELAGISGATTQGKHYPCVSVDEVASLKGEKISFYKDIKKVPMVSPDGKPYLTFKISTRKGAYSVVEKEIEEAEKTGLKTRRWTVLEGIKKCEDDRSGTDFVHERYVSIDKHILLTKEEYDNTDDKKKKDFELIKFASGCLKCPFAIPCRTDLKKQKSTSAWLQPIEAAIVEYRSSEIDFYNSQCLSLMPAKEGLVFGRYNETVHHVNYDEMFQIFTGTPPPRPMNKVDLINLFKMKGLKIYAGLDWGFTDPLAIVMIATDGHRAFIMETYAQVGLEVEKDVVPKLFELEREYGRFRIYPDTARPDNNSVLISKGFDVDDSFDKGKIDSGVTIIRSKLTPIAGAPLMYILKGHNSFLVDEIKKYHYVENLDGTVSDDIADEFNHSIDALRYAFINLFQLGADVIMVSGEKTAAEKVVEEKRAVIQSSPTDSFSNEHLRPDPVQSAGFQWNFGQGDDIDE